MSNTNIVETISGPPTEDWLARKWRPMMGWMYMTVCIFDFILFPIMWATVQSLDPDGSVINQWQPLTLQGAGLFHMAMGAVLGVAAYGRSQEKMAGVAGSSSTTPVGKFSVPQSQPEL